MSGADIVQQAIVDHDLDRLTALLDENPALVDAMGSVEYWDGTPVVTPLHRAAEQCWVEGARLLLDRGADPDVKHSPFDWRPLHFALEYPNAAVRELLIARGATVDIHAAAGLGDLERVRAMLAEQPERVHATGPDGATPLHFARTRAVAELLLEAGAELDQPDSFHGMTPLAWRLDSPEVVELLLSAGARVDLHLAAALGRMDIVQAAIEADASRIEEPSGQHALYGCAATPLRIAAQRGRADLVHWLLGQGADPNAFGGDGFGPLHGAVMSGDQETVELLIEAGADPAREDDVYHGNAAGWANHFGHDTIRDYLRSLSTG